MKTLTNYVKDDINSFLEWTAEDISKVIFWALIGLAAGSICFKMC